MAPAASQARRPVGYVRVGLRPVPVQQCGWPCGTGMCKGDEGAQGPTSKHQTVADAAGGEAAGG
jgi:hypothetical protein